MLALLLLACTPSPTAVPTSSPTLAERCFPHLAGAAIRPDYTGSEAVVPDHCLGTNHQDIADIGRVVFLGDSITAGTPPTPERDVYREVVTRELEDRFGLLQMASCAQFGATIDDLQSQIDSCFDTPSDVPVLVVFTVGGNDMVDWGQDLVGGASEAEVEARFQQRLTELERVVGWFGEHEELFPAGVDVVFGNVYEFTDTTGAVNVCPLAELFNVPDGVDAFGEGYERLNEAYLDIAVRTQTDMFFLFEQFCGHGFFHDDPDNACYRGPDAEIWFDGTCIHPSPEGHAQIAEMVLAIVDE